MQNWHCSHLAQMTVAKIQCIYKQCSTFIILSSIIKNSNNNETADKIEWEHW